MFKNSVIWLLLFGLVVLSGCAMESRQHAGNETISSEMKSDEANTVIKKQYVYKTTTETELKLNVYVPSDWKKEDKRAVIVFFFGGGWVSGTTDQFRSQSEYLASKGMVAITADYRVLSRHETSPIQSVEDGKSAIAWVRNHADELGIDPARVVASGGSAGGHVAASTAVIPGFIDETMEDTSRPNLLVLFNPVLDTSEQGFRNKALKMIAGRELEISPLHHVTPGLPDTLIFHGTADTIVPISQAEQFCQWMIEASNECKVVSFEGANHGFFNSGSSYDEVLKQVEQFLRDKGYLLDE